MIDPKNFRSTKPEGFNGETNVLGAGSYDVRVHKVAFTHDRLKSINEPTLKENQPEWLDKTEQVALVLQCKQGVYTTRLNLGGFKRFDEIPAKDRKGLVPAGDEMYAMEEKTKLRIPDPVRDQQCANILNQVMFACGLEEGASIEDLAGKTMNITIVEKQYNGRTLTEIKSYKRTGANSVVDLHETVAETVAETENVENESQEF